MVVIPKGVAIGLGAGFRFTAIGTKEADQISLYHFTFTRTIIMTLPFLEQFFTYEAVLKLLIRQRCKEAETIQKVLMVDKMAVSSGRRKDYSASKQELYDMFPPRRQWVHLGRFKRNGLSSRDKNEKSLLLTVLKEKQNEGAHPTWFVTLDERICQIIQASLKSRKLFSKPNVAVIEKKRDEKEKIIECRPICLFKTLNERVIASLFNRAFTQLFDGFFYENSLAFRPHKDGDAGMSHLNAIRKIKEFRKTHGGELWVAECDMKKFYDTLDHDLIKQRFCQMLHWSKKANQINLEEQKILKRAIYSYVDCFSFWRDVFKYNKKPKHSIWKSITNSTGYNKKIKWIDQEIKDVRRKAWPYRTKNHVKFQLGVPQGGALSGAIVNVMMHFVDIKLKRYWEYNDDFLYIRFCDDMTMMGCSEDDVKSAFERYEEVVKSNHLYIHDPESFSSKKMAEFWNGKTRPPYQWGKGSENVYPWITFVGYDINWEGDTRIRRSSVRKEIRKQYEKKMEIDRLLTGRRKRNPQWSRQYIMNSLQKRLIGMSVGRANLWDYKTFGNDCSWAKAFTELTYNRWSSKQLRLLDSHRNRMMSQIAKKLDTLDYSDIRPSDTKERSNALWFFGKPFSYYGQVFKKW